MPTTPMQRKLDMYEFLLDFIAHEIRNPLNSIIMFGNLLTEGAYGAVPQKQAEVLGRVLASAYRIEHMTGDFLNLRRVDGGEEMLHREWLDLKTDVVEATLRDLAAKFPHYAARLARVRRDGCCSAMRVFADRQMLLTVYDNLFFNALKYGRQTGKIVWGCGVCERTPGRCSSRTRGRGSSRRRSPRSSRSSTACRTRRCRPSPAPASGCTTFSASCGCTRGRSAPARATGAISPCASRCPGPTPRRSSAAKHARRRAAVAPRASRSRGDS